MTLHIRLLREAAVSVRAEEGDRIGLVAEEGGQFLRIVRDLRRVHSHIATLAYPILDKAHQQPPSVDLEHDVQRLKDLELRSAEC
jgi:hypothetical protein